MFLDDCPHGLGEAAWCTVCQGESYLPAVPKFRPEPRRLIVKDREAELAEAIVDRRICGRCLTERSHRDPQGHVVGKGCQCQRRKAYEKGFEQLLVWTDERAQGLDLDDSIDLAEARLVKAAAKGAQVRTGRVASLLPERRDERTGEWIPGDGESDRLAITMMLPENPQWFPARNQEADHLPV